MRNAPGRFILGALVTSAALARCNADTFTAPDAASPDAAAADGAATDSATDAAVDAVGDAPTSPCVGAEHWLCDDFDRDGALTDPPYWGSESVAGDAASLVMGKPVAPPPPSPPNALRATVGSGEEAAVFKQSVGSTGGLRCDFRLRIDKRGDFGTNLVLLSLASNGAYYRLQLVDGQQGDGFSDYGQLLDGGTFVAQSTPHLIATGVWTRISLVVALGTASAHATVTVDGIDIGFSAGTSLASFPAPTDVSVQLGAAAYTGAASTWSVDYDDVFCDLIPN